VPSTISATGSRTGGLEPRGFFPHTKYWSPDADLEPLREALDLCGWWKVEANASAAIRSRNTVPHE
jgi:hypothetical protein